MTATERLRELLDERGVEYDKAATVIGGTVATFWHDRDGYSCSAIEGADDIPDGEVSVQACVTPEQAIAATLGAGQATDEWGEGFRAGCDAANKASEESVEHYKAENAKLREKAQRQADELTALRKAIEQRNGEWRPWKRQAERLVAENAKLREQLERVQPTDCEGNVLEIADTVHMLRSEYDGDHEWEDVVTELVLTKWGGDRWIVRGSKGEAWACDCAKTGYDEDAYEASDDVEPFGEPTLLEAENAKLRELVRDLMPIVCEGCHERLCDMPKEEHPFVECLFDCRIRDLGIEVGK